MEGIIKYIEVDPVKLMKMEEEEPKVVCTRVLLKVHFDAAALADLYEAAGIDPENVRAYHYIMVDGEPNGEQINLAEAVRTNTDVNYYTYSFFSSQTD